MLLHTCKLEGKCVPFDWVSFTAMLLHMRYPELLKLEKRQLWVGSEDASVLVLDDPRVRMEDGLTSKF